MARKSFNPKECIKALNNIKQSVQISGNPISKKDLLNAFKKCGLPCSGTFWQAFRSFNIIEPAGQGKYYFVGKEPIYWEKLANIQNKYLELLKRYKNNTNNKKKSFVPEKVIPIVEPKEDLKSEIELAIELLKKNNYRIFAPSHVIYTEI